MPEKAVKIVNFTVLLRLTVVCHFRDETSETSLQVARVNQLDVEFVCTEELRLAVVKKRE